MTRSNFTFKKIFFLITCLFVSIFIKAQNIELNQRITISKDTIYLGEISNIKINIKSSNYPIDSISSKFTRKIHSKLHIYKERPWAKINDQTWEKQLFVTGFDSGKFALPPIDIEILYKNKQKTTKLNIDSIALNVVPMPIDTSQAFKPIKDIYEIAEPPSQSKWWIWLLIIVATILLFIVIFIIYKKRKKKKSIEAYKYNPYISPIEEVKQSLQQLKDNNGITQMNAKEYYTKLTDVLRRFLFRLYNINAFEMLSSELFIEMHKYCNAKDLLTNLQIFLNTSDLAKFAKYTPTIEERFRDYEFCEKFTQYLWEQEQLKNQQHE